MGWNEKVATGLASNIIASGEKVVGSTSAGNAVQLTATSTACRGVLLMAPTPKAPARTGKPAGGVNGDFIMAKVAAAAPTHAQALLGSVPVNLANYEGVFVPVDDASKVYLAGFVAGDAVEYAIIG